MLLMSYLHRFACPLNLATMGCPETSVIKYPMLCNTQKRRSPVLVMSLHKSTSISRIFRTDALTIMKLTIRPIGRHHPRSNSLPHIDSGPTVLFMVATLAGSPFLSECQELSAIRPGSQWYQTGVLSASI
jgi:hypothetical protein